jgi:hypothetical protein
MTAMSAQRASGNATDATNPTANAHVRIPGSPRTYEVRDVLRGMGLRWDPLSHAWHGMLPGDQGSRLARDLGLKLQIVPTIEAFASESTLEPLRGLPGRPEPPRPPIRVPKPRDGSRTRAEARLAFPGADDDLDEAAVGDHRFSVLEITSGLPDDSREADERVQEQMLRDLRGRVKVARAAISAVPGAERVLDQDSEKAARFYVRFGISSRAFLFGVPAEIGAEDPPGGSDNQRGSPSTLPFGR